MSELRQSNSGRLPETDAQQAPEQHVITNSWTTLSIRCAGCDKTWEQDFTDPNDPGWNVCPYCLRSAPTVARDGFDDA